MKSAKKHSIKTLAGCFLLTLSLIFSLVGCQFASFTSPDGNEGTGADEGENSLTPPENVDGGTEDAPKDETPPKPLFYNRYTGLTCDEAVSSCRPVSVCIGNFDGKRQEGLSFADILIETPVPGEETRLWAITNDLQKIAAIKNIAAAEPYMFTNAKAFDAVSVFNGAKEIPSSLPNLNYASGTLGSYFSSTDGLVSSTGTQLKNALEANSVSLSETQHSLPFAFTELGTTFKPQGNHISNIYFAFSEKNTVSFTYNEESGSYFRSQSGTVHKDDYNGAQLAFENVILLFSNVSYYHSPNGTTFALDSTSGGSGFCYTGGGVENISWSVSEDGTLLFRGTNGEIITVNRGKTYIGVLRVTDSTTLIAR